MERRVGWEWKLRRRGWEEYLGEVGCWGICGEGEEGKMRDSMGWREEGREVKSERGRVLGVKGRGG